MSDLIVISGGGWMGNVWPQHERLIQKLVVRFARQRVIIMPQTIYYDRGIEPYRSLISDSKRAFGQSNNLTLCLRDKASYEFASSELNIENAVLVPDIALSYLPFVKRVPTRERDKKVAFCLREDQECAREKSTTELLEAFFQEKDVPCGVIDTLNNTPVSLSERKTVLEKKFGEFSSYSLIVTDRLHAMVFAYLTGTPCIVIDNLTCKVSGVYNSWLKDCEYIHPLFHSNCTEDLFEWIEEMMAGRYEPAESNLCSEGLKRLEDAINNG